MRANTNVYMSELMQKRNIPVIVIMILIVIMINIAVVIYILSDQNLNHR